MWYWLRGARMQAAVMNHAESGKLRWGCKARRFPMFIINSTIDEIHCAQVKDGTNCLSTRELKSLPELHRLSLKRKGFWLPLEPCFWTPTTPPNRLKKTWFRSPRKTPSVSIVALRTYSLHFQHRLQNIPRSLLRQRIQWTMSSSFTNSYSIRTFSSFPRRIVSWDSFARKAMVLCSPKVPKIAYFHRRCDR